MMVDYIKGNLIGNNREALKSNNLLEFKSILVSKTGEIKPCRIDIDRNGNEIPIFKEVAYYRGIKFIDFSNGITQLEFTPHKYFNISNKLGNQNFNDFGVNEIEWVLNDLKSKFNISPFNIVLRLVEVGVNLTDIGISIEDVINSCLMHKRKRFALKKDDKYGHYISVEYDDYEVKIYDKGKQFKKLNFKVGEVLRIEIKYTKLRKLKSKGIFTFQDLLDYGLENFKKELVTEWNNILYYDSSINSKDKRLSDYSNISYWKDLTTKGNENKYKYHKNEFRLLSKKYSENWQSKIANFITDKIIELNNNTSILHHFQKKENQSNNIYFTPLFKESIKQELSPNYTTIKKTDSVNKTPILHYSNSKCKMDVDEFDKQNKKDPHKIEFFSYKEQKELIAEHNRLAVLSYNLRCD